MVDVVIAAIGGVVIGIFIGILFAPKPKFIPGF